MSEQSHARVLMIGLDSATLDLIDPLVKAGELPNFERLMREGAWGQLESVPNMNSAPAWSSIVTGKNPGKHGVFWFVEDDPQRYTFQYINASFRTAEPIWCHLSRANRQVGVMNVPISYPAEHVRGFLIAGLDAPSTHAAGFCHPPDLVARLRRKLGEYVTEPGVPSLMKAGKTDEAVRMLRWTITQRLGYARHLMTEEPWDFFFVVFTALDSAQHFFWKYMQPDHFQVPPEEQDAYGQVIPDVYRMLDAAIGELVGLAGPDAFVIVLSDHGMGSTDGRNKLLPYWLESLGLLTLKDEQSKPSSLLRRGRETTMGLLADLYRGADRRLNRDVKMWLAKRFPKLRRATEAHLQVGRIVWPRTTAYANGKRSEIWINLKGRQRQGIVEPGREYEDLCAFIAEQLSGARDPLSGEPYVERVYRREEVYDGPWVDRSPDLIVRWHPGGRIDNFRFGGRTGAEIKDVVKYLDPIFELGSGHHTPYGIMLLHGRGIQAGVRIEGAQVYDVSPTLLYLMGLPIPADMDGRVLAEAIESRFLATRPVERVDAAPMETGGRTGYTSAEEEIVSERLRNLGYVE